MTSSQHAPVVLSYARALLELAGTAQAQAVGAELAQLRGIFESNPTFSAFLANPSVGQVEREQVLARALKGKVQPLLWNFLGLLNSKGRIKSLAEISAAFDDLLDEQLGKVEVDVTTAQKLDPEQVTQVRQTISQAIKRDAVLHNYVDDSIIGGMIVRVQDKLIDASVRQQLQSIRQRMLAARPR